MALAKLFRRTSFSPFRTIEDQLDKFMIFGAGTIGKREMIEEDFVSIVSAAYKASGPVFTCILVRGLGLSEARFQFQHMEKGRPGKLFGNSDLALLEKPWVNAATGDLIWRMEQHSSLAGNFFGYVKPRTSIRVLRPDWVTIVSGVRGDPEASAYDIDAEILGYIYQPTGSDVPDATFITPERMIHYAPIPDPEAQWRGMSWVTPIADEVMGDRWAQKHKIKFFEQGTVASLGVTYDKSIPPEKLEKFKKIFEEKYAGTDNAYKALHFGGGADVKALGFSMEQLTFRELSASAETRIAAASGVGSVIARFSEGLEGSALNAGNYGAAKRQIADMTFRPLWRAMATSLDKPSVVAVPGDARLWYDPRDIEFLKEDRKDAADIMNINAQTAKALIESGYAPDDVLEAVDTGDLTMLVGSHTGLLSVQLQRPGNSAIPATATDTPPVPALNP